MPTNRCFLRFTAQIIPTKRPFHSIKETQKTLSTRALFLTTDTFKKASSFTIFAKTVKYLSSLSVKANIENQSYKKLLRMRILEGKLNVKTQEITISQ